MTAPLEPWLDKHGISYHPNRQGNQPIKCPNTEWHKNGDKTPSASLNLGKQLWNCLACGEGGSAVDLVMLIEGKSLRDALRLTEGGSPGGSGEVQHEPQRSSLGLPVRARVHRGDGGKPPTWAGFR